MSVNKVILLGRLGANPEIRYTPSGAPVANFNIATSESWNDKGGQKQERTEWHRIVVWNKLAELCNQYLAKGRQAYIEGRLQTRQWDDKDGNKRYTTEVIATTVQFLGGPNQSAGAGAGAGAGANDYAAAPAASGSGGAAPEMADSSFSEDEIPF